MTDNKIIQQNQEENELWAVVEIFGHGQTAGRVSRNPDWLDLVQVDIPDGDGGYNTELLGPKAIFRIKPVSEEVALAYAPKPYEVHAYDTPIVTREQHQSDMRRLEVENSSLRSEIHELKRRLTQVNALPESTSDVVDGPSPEDILF